MTESATPPDLATRWHKTRSLLLQIAGAVVLVAVGVGVAQFLVATKRVPEGKATEAAPRLVRVMEATRASHRCSTTAFGTSAASREWTAIAETAGDAVLVDAKFEPGEILAEGTLLVQIDPEDYRLAQRRYESEAVAREAQLNELKETEKNLIEIRDLQKEQLDLAQKDLVRIQGLLEGGTVTESAADSARTAHLTRLLAFQETTNSLSLIPVLRARAEAERDAAAIQVEQAKREIDECSIRLPFDARCVSKSIEQDQYVNVGQTLGSFLNMDTAEVVAMVEARKGRTLFPRGIPGLEHVDMGLALENDELYRGALGLLDAEIHWGTPPRRGKVTRIGSSLDPATRTFPVIIEVADPYAEVSPGVRPPLVPDVFCEVTLYGATVDEVIVIPRDCLHEVPRTSLSDELIPVVYLLRGGTKAQRDGATYCEGGRLKIQEVEILVMEEDVVVIDTGLEEGDLVVLGDLYVPREHWGAREFGPASEAMPLRGLLEVPPNLHRQGPDPLPARRATQSDDHVPEVDR
jgi:multidrug efflux system membrane fusion protein